MKKILQHSIITMGTFDYILFGQANKAFAYSLLPKGIQHHCSKSFFYKCLAIRATQLLKEKEQYLSSAERYYNQASIMHDPSTGAPKLCVNLFMKYLENHKDATIKRIAGLEQREHPN